MVVGLEDRGIQVPMSLEHDSIVGTQCCDNTVPSLVRPDPRVRQRILPSRYVQIYWNGPHCVSRVANKTNKSEVNTHTERDSTTGEVDVQHGEVHTYTESDSTVVDEFPPHQQPSSSATVLVPPLSLSGLPPESPRVVHPVTPGRSSSCTDQSHQGGE